MTTTRFHLKTLLLITFLLLSGRMYAQPMLWHDIPSETVVFELTNKEALKLLKGKFKQKQWDKILQTPFAQFTDTWTNPPAKGHYLYATVERNEVRYRYIPFIPFQVFLFHEYGALTLQVVDSEGTIRQDAKVRIGNRVVSYDKESQTYTNHNESRKEQHLLTVELDTFRAIFDLRKHLVPSWARHDSREDTPDFYSYLITDKNKYKPAETVRFKSYALSEYKRPLEQELSLWMRTDRWGGFKKILSVTPYHPGGFSGEFQLADSLNLKLDKDYTIQLRDKRGRIVASSSFRYEDYELNGNKLKVELASSIQYSPRNNQVQIAATDANGLPLRETNVEVIVGRQNVLQSYVDVLSLPDTLMNIRAELDAAGKAVVDIPATIFGASDCSYNVQIVLLTADNQRLEQKRWATFYHSCYNFDFSTQADTLRIAMLELGVERPVEAELSDGEKKETKKVHLPYREPFNQANKGYWLRVPEINFERYIPSASIDTKVRLNGGIMKDSLCVTLENPLKLECSWYVHQGNRLLQKGSGKEMEYKSGEIEPSSVYYVEVFYFIGNEEFSVKRSYSSPSEHLFIESDLPERVYPGQKVKTTLNVSNAQGNPVADVDMTAFAVNSQLDYYTPDLPYYGNAPLPREQRATYSMSEKNYIHKNTLDYDYWNRVLHLNQLPYYQLAYPSGNLFRMEIDTPDGTTQFAPYVVKDGKAVNVYVIEQNDIPCYFSWMEQPAAYSFRVLHPTGKQTLTLRIDDRAFIIDSIAFTPGKKTILSFDMERLAEGVSALWINRAQGEKYMFTEEEKSRYEQYICRLPVAVLEDYTCLRQGVDLFPVSIRALSRSKEIILAGPVAPGYWQYMDGIKYRHEGGFSYAFEGNVVYKYADNELCPPYLYRSYQEKITTLNDFCLTPARFRDLVDEQRNGKSWHPSQILLSQSNKKIDFYLPAEKDSTGVANLLFRNSMSGKLIYPDVFLQKRRAYSEIPAGMYDVILLYNNGKYLKKDTLPISPYTYLRIDMKHQALHEADSLSAKWLLLNRYNENFTKYAPHTKEWKLRQTMQHNGSRICGFIYAPGDEPLIGCSVQIKGTQEGTVSNQDGYFELNCNRAEGVVLLFNYIGYKPQEIKVFSGMELAVTMEEHSQTLDEVVVVGYGMQEGHSLTAAFAGASKRSSKASSSASPEKQEDAETERSKVVDNGQLYNELMQLNGLRRNFSDVGFWQPRLFTDKEGKAQFEVTFPDNITKWEAVAYAMNQHLQTGTFRRDIRSYKPLMAELKTPAFMVVGDHSETVGTIRNYMEGQPMIGKTQFCVGSDTLKQSEVSLTEGFHEALPIDAADTDSVTMRYLFTRNDGYKDGEEYTIPVLPQGTELAQGTLVILSKDACIEVKADANEKVYVSVTNNPLDIYKESVNYLTGYKYLCNEQLASKLIGLLAYRKCMQYKGEEVKVDRNIKSILRRLTNNRNKHQLWAWWGNAETTSFWMSAHILHALKMANDAGYPVELNLQSMVVNYVHTSPYRGIRLEDIEILQALSEWGVPADYVPATKLLESFVRQKEQKEDSLARKDKHYRSVSYLKEKLLLWEIRQRTDSVNMLDSVRPYLKKDIVGGVYCDDGKQSSYWKNDKLSNTLIAYRIIKNAPSSNELKDAMQLYILRTKERGWNTYQAATAISTVLDDLLSGTDTKQASTKVIVSGKENKEIATYPYQLSLNAGENVTLTKTGNEPLLYSTYSMKWTKNARESDAFKIESVLENDTLSAGVPVKLEVTLQVKQERAQYVMIEIPIPAGCSYASKPVHYFSHEVHREYYKEKTVIFCENLPIGTYKFSIPLLPRYTGKYTLNPAKVELMYFPVVNANNAGRNISIQGSRRVCSGSLPRIMRGLKEIKKYE